MKLGEYSKNRTIVAYNEKPFRRVLIGPKEKARTPVGYGMELEFNFRCDSEEESADLKALLDAPAKWLKTHYIWKRDGSINGAELVTAPLTLARWRKVNLREILQKLWQAGARGYNDQCGLHIHRSRADLLDYHIVILRRLIVANQDRLILFCKRSTRFAEIPRYINSPWDAGHYDALSVTSKTIEWRMPRGTSDYKRIKASLLMFDAMVEFARSFSRKERAMLAQWLPQSISPLNQPYYAIYNRILSKLSWMRFRDFLQVRDQYQFLAKYLKTQGLWTVDQ